MKKFAALVDSLKLREHQEKAIDKFIANRGEGLFFHGLGSGKTISSVAAVEKINAKKPLILTPASLQKNYKDTVNHVVSPDSRSKYNIMSYEKFRRDPDKFIKEIAPDMIVVDEFHRQKDPNGVSFNALLKARPHVKYFLGLTGTAIQNRPSELNPLMHIVSNGRIPLQSQKDFEKEYVKLQKVYPKGIAGLLARATGRFGEKKVLKNVDKLKSKTSPYIDKNEPTPEFLSNFPKKEIVDIETPMTSEQQKTYNYMMKKDLGFMDRWRIKHDLPPKMKNSGSFFSRLSALRQISNTPSIFRKSIKDPVISSGKMTEAVKNLKNHLDKDPLHKAVVYSNFTRSGLGSVEEALNKNKINYGVFSGDIAKKLRGEEIENFNKGKKRVLLISPSGAEGLDLKGVTLLQNLDPNWNPEKMNQVFGRAVRFKSHEALPPNKRNVRIERYISVKKPGTFKKLLHMKPETSIDQYIYHRAKEKQDLNDQLNNALG